MPVAIGFAVVAGFLMLSYWHKLSTFKLAGITSEMSGLTTYLIGALVYRDQIWIATTIAVAGMFLLEMKSALEGLTQRIAPEEQLIENALAHAHGRACISIVSRGVGQRW